MKTTYYFNEEVDQALADMKKAESKKDKNAIFVEKIMPAFEKLISYHYFRLPVSKNPDLIQDCMIDLYEKINNFDTERYSRGFPYFNMITKNFFVQELKRQEKVIDNDKYPISLSDYNSQRGLLDEYLVEDLEEAIDEREFIESFKENLLKWRKYFKKDQEKILVDALIMLFESADSIEIFNKKAVFWYLREMTDMNSKQIASNLAKMKIKFEAFKKKYQAGDI